MTFAAGVIILLRVAAILSRAPGIVIATALGLALVDCSRGRDVDAVGKTTLTASTVSTGVDHVKMSESDRSGAPSPLDPSTDPADLDLTKDIRDALMADDTISLDAKSIRIVVRDGHVTLLGPVRGKREHDVVLTRAREFAGIAWVDDRLEIK